MKPPGKKTAAGGRKRSRRQWERVIERSTVERQCKLYYLQRRIEDDIIVLHTCQSPIIEVGQMMVVSQIVGSENPSDRRYFCSGDCTDEFVRIIAEQARRSREDSSGSDDL